MTKELLTADPLVQKAERYLARLERQKAAYAELKNRAPELYERCAASASAISSNHSLGLKGACEVEMALVRVALDALDYT
jgi:hypothetical protein